MSTNILEALAKRAARHAEAENWDAARAAWLEALARAPDFSDAMLELSYVESLAGNYRRARDWTLRAAQARPGTLRDFVGLLRRLRTFNEVGGVHAIVDELHGCKRPDRVELLVESAVQLGNLNDHAAALRCAEAAVAAAPSDVRAHLIKGESLAYHGRIDAAIAEIEWVVRRVPRVAPAWWMLSRLRRHTSALNHLDVLSALLAAPDLGPLEYAMLAFALHKELDDIGEFQGAWHALDRACKAKRSTLKYDTEESRKLVEALLSMPLDVSSSHANVSAHMPIFIVGMHRSGTTLLEQLLDASPQVRGVGELYDFTSAMRYATDHHCKGVIDESIVRRASTVDLAEVGRRYLDGIAWRLGSEPYFTDKLPSNFLNLGFICRALPQARILHMVRDPIETCFSNLREMFSDANPYSYDQHELADFFVQYRRLMAHWKAAFPGRILDVDYAELTRDPEATMRKVAGFCGMNYVAGMRSTASSMRAVSTASAVQVRGEVSTRERPKWASYAKWLQPLIERLRRGGIDVQSLPY